MAKDNEVMSCAKRKKNRCDPDNYFSKQTVTTETGHSQIF